VLGLASLARWIGPCQRDHCRCQGHQRRSDTSKHWVPLPGHKGLEGSDAENISLVDWKPCAWRNPMCAAQAHYSFFQNYRAGSLEVRGAEVTASDSRAFSMRHRGQDGPATPTARPCPGTTSCHEARSKHTSAGCRLCAQCITHCHRKDG